MSNENIKKDNKPVTRQDLEQILDKLLNKPKSEQPVNTQDNIVNQGIQAPNQPNAEIYPPINQLQPRPPFPPQNQMQQVPLPKLTPAQEKRVIAQQILKLHKSIMILCLICFIFLPIIVLVSMMDPMMGLIIAFVSIIYPAMLYSKSVKAQEYFSQKYNLKPFTLFKQPRRQPPMNQQGDFF
jgi:hypothetical protein